MRLVGPYTIETREPGQETPWFFNCVATSRAEAERLFRRGHPRWRIVAIQEPATPTEADATPRPAKRTRRKKT